MAFVPFMFWLAAVLGLTGFGLGIAGIARTRGAQPAPNRNLAITGTVLGGVAVIAAVVSFYLWTRWMEDVFDGYTFDDEFVDNFGVPADEADYDISIDACEVRGGQARSEGVVTNTSGFTTGFGVEVSFWDSQDMWQASDYYTVSDLAPGESLPFTVSADVDSEYVDCEITAVYYY